MKYGDITDDLARQWLNDKTTNPLTGRTIKECGPTYNLYDSYCDDNNITDEADYDTEDSDVYPPTDDEDNNWNPTQKQQTERGGFITKKDKDEFDELTKDYIEQNNIVDDSFGDVIDYEDIECYSFNNDCYSDDNYDSDYENITKMMDEITLSDIECDSDDELF